MGSQGRKHYYDSFPSSLKTFSYSRANTSSFAAATRSQPRILSRRGNRALLRALLPWVAAPSRPKLVLEAGPLNFQKDADPARLALPVGG